MNRNGNSTLRDGANFEVARRDMVARQIRERGVRSARVLAAMETVPRHLFVPFERVPDAYADEALPVGEGQTISQPYVVAASAEALALEGHERVLEIGAGTGYQAAVLSLLAREVIAVEAIPSLAESARERLARLGYLNVRVEQGDGSLGFPSDAPYGDLDPWQAMRTAARRTSAAGETLEGDGDVFRLDLGGVAAASGHF